MDALVAEGANIAYAVTYGVYSMEGDSLDSAIKAEVYYDLDAGQVVRIDFEEALIPCAAGGAKGWAGLSEETTAALGDAVVTLDSAVYPMYFELGDIRFTGSEADGMVLTFGPAPSPFPATSSLLKTTSTITAQNMITPLTETIS